ncbi:hypothetical protein CRG98_011155 [Punica granatum]|uniref:Retrotransposon gag domain-containing protein n=1 Tax=Punica granatum TaxID=22663 RepID=A0A2I0KKX6_PUNGR|nr:hypothetical protein CRG98_011155 [Punica granatum]
MHIWRTLRPVDHAFIQGIIGDMVMFTETPVDWIFLRTAIEFWDPEHAVFNFHGTELAPTIEEYTALIQRSTPTTQGIFVPNPFATIRTQVVLQAVGGHSYVKALLAETVRSLDYVREVRRGRMRGSPHLLQIWLLAHVRPFCSSHPFSYITDEHSLIERLVPVIPPPEHSFSKWRHFWRKLTPTQFLWVARWNPDGPMITGCPGIVGVPLLSHLGSTLIFPGRIREIHRQRDASTIQRLYFPEHPTDEERAFSATLAYVARFYWQGSTSSQRSQDTPTPRAAPTLAPEAESSAQAAMPSKLRAIRKERDRLRCELADSRAEVITTGVAPLPDSSAFQDGGRGSSRYLRRSQPTGSGSFSTTPDARSTASDSYRHTPGVFGRPSYTSPAPDVFRGAPSTSLADIILLRRPSPHHGTRGHGQPNGLQHGRAARPAQRTKPCILELHASTRTRAYSRPDSSGSADSSPGEHGCTRTTNTACVHGSPFHQPISAATGPHGRPSSTGDILVLGAGPVRTSSYLYTGPSRGLYSASTDGLPGIKRTCSDSPSSCGTSSVPVSTTPQRRLKRMKETIRALLASDARPDARYGYCSLFQGMRLPPKLKIPEFKTYEGTTDPRHHLCHYRGKMLQYWEYEEFVIHSFQDSLSESALDWFMSLRAEDIPTWEDLSRKFIDQYQYCAEALPTLLELSTKEMA